MAALSGLLDPKESRSTAYDKLFAKQENVIEAQQKSMQEMEAACARLRKTVQRQKSLLASFVTLSGLISFQMADMANVALKHGYYFEASEDDDWID